jgi:serine/threonine protein kinase
MLELVAANPCPYHPPEVLGGAAWSVAGDVYALAATLFALLSGRAPHGGGDGAVLRAMAGPPPRLPRDGLPDAVHAALRRALDPEPAARHPSPATLAEELCAAAPAPAPAGSAVPTPPPAPPGERAGRPLGSNYLLHEPIGTGASGQVWRASRRHDGSRVAVKLLRREHATNPEMVARFLQERTALLSVGHPHLVRVRDLVAEGEVLALVMDLVDGVDLRRTMATARLGRADACTLLGQVVAALAAVHVAGIVHRDVKARERPGGTRPRPAQRPAHRLRHRPRHGGQRPDQDRSALGHGRLPRPRGRRRRPRHPRGGCLRLWGRGVRAPGRAPPVHRRPPVRGRARPAGARTTATPRHDRRPLANRRTPPAAGGPTAEGVRAP